MISLSFSFQAPSKLVGEMTTTEHDLGLVSRSLTLTFTAEKKYTQGDSIAVECVSTLPGVPHPPQATTDVAAYKAAPPPQVINNQKLQLQSATSSSPMPKHVCYYSLFLVLLLGTVRWY